MNVENINTLIGHLRSLPDHAFNLGHYMAQEAPEDELNFISCWNLHENTQVFKSRLNENWCGTSGCIAGHIQMFLVINDRTSEFFEKPLMKGLTPQAMDVKDVGRIFLGITHSDATNLFNPDSNNVDYDRVGIHEAIAVLENLRDTGAVDYNILPNIAPEETSDED